MLKKYPLVLIAARNGVLGGVFGMALVLVLFYLGKHPLLIPEYMDYRIFVFVFLLILTLKEFRDYYRQGLLSFFEAMGMCLIFTIAFSTISFFVLWLFGLWKPEFVTQYAALRLEQFSHYPPETIKQIGPAQFEAALKSMKATNAASLAYWYFEKSFIISFFLSIIISLILRRQPKL